MTRPRRRALALLTLAALALGVLTLSAWSRAQAAAAPVDWARVSLFVGLFVGLGGVTLALWAIRTLGIERLRTGLRHPDVVRDVEDMLERALSSERVAGAISKRVCSDLGERLDQLEADVDVQRRILDRSPFGRHEDHGPPPDVGAERRHGPRAEPKRRASGPVSQAAFGDPPRTEDT